MTPLALEVVYKHQKYYKKWPICHSVNQSCIQSVSWSVSQLFGESVSVSVVT